MHHFSGNRIWSPSRVLELRSQMRRLESGASPDSGALSAHSPAKFRRNELRHGNGRSPLSASSRELPPGTAEVNNPRKSQIPELALLRFRNVREFYRRLGSPKSAPMEGAGGCVRILQTNTLRHVGLGTHASDITEITRTSRPKLLENCTPEHLLRTCRAPAADSEQIWRTLRQA